MLFDTLKRAKDEARLAKDEHLAALLGTVVGAGETVGKQRENRPPNDAEMLVVIKKFVNGARETAGLLRDREIADKRLARCGREIEVLEGYLPRAPGEAELRSAADAFVAANPGCKMGAVMAHLKTTYGAAFDGNVAKGIVTAALEPRA